MRQLSGKEAAAGLRAGLQQRASTSGCQTYKRLVQQADVIFYAVNPGGPSIKLNLIAMRAERGMEAIAEATGGTAFVPDSDLDLERVFRQVAAELRGQYLLQYYGDSRRTGWTVSKNPGCGACTHRRSRPREARLLSKETRLKHCRLPIPIADLIGNRQLAMFSFRRSHQQQHIRQSIDHVEQLPAGGVELIGCRSLFRGCGAGGDARQFDVEGLKFRRGAEVDLEFVETLANIPE